VPPAAALAALIDFQAAIELVPEQHANEGARQPQAPWDGRANARQHHRCANKPKPGERAEREPIGRHPHDQPKAKQAAGCNQRDQLRAYRHRAPAVCQQTPVPEPVSGVRHRTISTQKRRDARSAPSATLSNIEASKMTRQTWTFG